MVAPPVPSLRLSSLYFFYFAVAGALVPFWALYLKDCGLDGLQIGVVLAVMSITKMGAPNLWGWIADRSGQHVLITQLAIGVCTLCFLGVWSRQDYAWLLLVMLFYSFFWNAIQPQFEAITLHTLGGDMPRYSRVRAWGSVSFILCVVGLGVLFDRISVQHLPAIVVGLMIALLLASFFAPNPKIAHSASVRLPFVQYLQSPVVIAFFVCSLLVQIAHGAYYSFFTLYLESLDFSRSATGSIWAIGVVAEILAFFYMSRIVGRWSARSLMLFSLVVCIVRWIVIAAFPQQLFWLVLVQVGHAATFGVIHTVSIQFVHQRFPAAVAGQGQALYTAISFGVGGALGNLGSGILWEAGYLAGPFWMAVVASILALGVAYWLFDPQPRDVVVGR
ncbi:Putative mfs metabolite transporter [gamma proteobacterium HdN1]|nr:Putative mfs metabolite transporter [gamma proteobacterium HdN1]